MPTELSTAFQAQYFQGKTLDPGSLLLSRNDQFINFNWGSRSPDAKVANDNFSARWTGQIQATTTGSYTFTTTSDDGVRLWVNGHQLVNNWTDHAGTDNSGTIVLQAGQKYNVKMEYYESGGDA
ncbi:MAG: putative baseplate assembly protein, partial [Candidatus Parcubacteria bacterium]|nr:putative baseplate assembly protein [Leptolyngbyaceae cyanobacterium LF-bin-113]